MPAHRPLDLLALVQSQQSRIDKDARELIADCPVHERRGHGGVHAARETADDLSLSHQSADFRDFAFDEGTWGPARRGAADFEQEVRDELATAGRMRDLAVKLHPEDRT